MSEIVVVVMVSVLGLVAVTLLAGVLGALVLALLLVRRLTSANDVLTSKVMLFAEREASDLRLDRYGPGRADKVRVMQSASVAEPEEGYSIGSLISRGSMGGGDG